MKKRNQGTKERKQRKKMLEERWAMTRWITNYIDENTERWKKEKLERKENEKRTAQEWAKMERLEKIRVIQEKCKKIKLWQ